MIILVETQSPEATAVKSTSEKTTSQRYLIQRRLGASRANIVNMMWAKKLCETTPENAVEKMTPPSVRGRSRFGLGVRASARRISKSEPRSCDQCPVVPTVQSPTDRELYRTREDCKPRSAQAWHLHRATTIFLARTSSSSGAGSRPAAKRARSHC